MSSTYFGPGASRPVIRGLGGDRIRVLEDGVGAGDASSTSPDHAVSIEPVAAETIEVVRGPATLLYGSSAVGGVVNVLDGRIPDRAPDHTLGGTLDLLGGLGQRRVERRRVAQGRRGPDRVPRRLRPAQDRGPEDPGLRRVRAAARVRGGEDEGEEHEEAFGVLPNSAIDSTSGTVGASYVGSKGFFGASWTGFDTLYGIPGGHAHEEAPVEGAPAEEPAAVRVDLEQRRFDVRGERTEPFGAFRGVKLRFGLADYQHQELEGDEVGTLFTERRLGGPPGAAAQARGRVERLLRRAAREPGLRGDRRGGLRAADRDPRRSRPSPSRRSGAAPGAASSARATSART